MIEKNLTPKEIVQALDQHVIGQDAAKRLIAIALRNRYRRLQLPLDQQADITPKNILMIGPTGVGKTEIARRLALLVQAPFVKVEATKYTEVGYVGRDVESMVRDLAESALILVKQQKRKEYYAKAYRKAVRELAKQMRPGIKKEKKTNDPFASMMQMMGQAKEPEYEEEVTSEITSSRRELQEKLQQGLLDQQEVTIKIEEKPLQMADYNPMMEQMGAFQEMMSKMTPKKKVERTVTVKEALDLLTEQLADSMINEEDLHAEAIRLAEKNGIIFIDEIDKIAVRNQQAGQVSREGVQRDILPIVEGSQVKTKYGILRTDHVLFIGSGAFHMAKPSDLIPELQGRFPIRVELNDLSKTDFYRILTEPKSALLTQYKALLATEDVTITFTKEAIEKMAEIAYNLNRETDNIGARRLHTVLEKVLEELLFEAGDMQGADIQITAHYVEEQIGELAANKDAARYIL